MNTVDIIIICIIAVLVILAVSYMVKRKKSGKCVGCSGDCSKCSGGCINTDNSKDKH